MKRKPLQASYITCLIPPPAVRRAFMQAAGPFPESAVPSRSEDLHITMNELQVPRKRSLPDLLQRLGALEFPQFEIRITDADCFNRIPRAGVQNNVVWLRPDGKSGWDVQDLHKKIHLSLRSVGYPVGRMEVRPHLTILKQAFNENAGDLRDYLEQAAQAEYPVWSVDRFYLTSRLHPDDPQHPKNNGGKGSKFEVIGSFPLKPAPDGA